MSTIRQEKFEFAELAGRRVESDFSGGYLSSDGGVLLLRETDRSLGLTDKLAGCFSDERDHRFVEHQISELVSQRLMGLALGYEDLNDHDALRLDPLLAVAVGKADPTGRDDSRPVDLTTFNPIAQDDVAISRPTPGQNRRVTRFELGLHFLAFIGARVDVPVGVDESRHRGQTVCVDHA